MIFKKLKFFRLTKKYKADELSKLLAACAFQPCGQMDQESRGWVPPMPHGEYAHAVQGSIIMALKIEKKSVPGSHVKKLIEERSKEMEARQGYKVGRAQKREMKEAIIAELLPKAFPKDKVIHVLIKDDFLMVNGTSKDADTVIEALKIALEEVPLVVIQTETSPSFAMTSWLTTGEAPDGFTVDRECELRSNDEEKSTVKFARHNLDDEKVIEHLREGKQVCRLAMTYNDRVSFNLLENMEISGLKFLDILTEQVQQESEGDEQAVFDVELVLMGAEFSELIKALLVELVEKEE